MAARSLARMPVSLAEMIEENSGRAKSRVRI
jgi:hypothetical protein